MDAEPNSFWPRNSRPTGPSRAAWPTACWARPRGRRRRPGGVAAARRRADLAAIENLGGWLTTVVARVCLDMLRSRRRGARTPTGRAVPDRRRRRRRTRARRACWPTPSASRCWWCSTRWRRPNGWRSCCTTCSRCRSTRSRRSSAASPDGRAAARQPRSPRGAGHRRCSRRRPHPAAENIVDAFIVGLARRRSPKRLLAVLDPDVVFRADDAAQRLGSLRGNPRRRGGGRNLQGPRAGRKARAGRWRAGRSPSSSAGNCASCCA